MKEFLPLIAIVTFLISCSLGKALRGPAGDVDHSDKNETSRASQKDSEQALSGGSSAADATSTIPRLKVQKIATEAIFVVGEGSSKCPAYQFALSSHEMTLDKSEQFCESLNKSEKREGKYWELADTNAVARIRYNCEFEVFAAQVAAVKAAFQVDAKQERLNVWMKYPPATAKHYPYQAMHYPMKIKAALPELDHGRPLDPRLAPALCILYRE